MAWPDKVKDPMVITTGDGVRYTPLYVGVKKETTYNIAEFNYPEVRGTEVNRGMPQGSRFALELSFQGPDHLDLSDAFSLSAEDRRPWRILHPVFGTLVAQPLGLNFDSSGMSITVITGTVVETITGDFPVVDQDPSIKTKLDVQFFNEASAASFAITGPAPDVVDINSLRAVNDGAYKQGSAVVKSGPQANEYFNLFSDANRAVINATSDPLLAIQSVKSLLMYPAMFEDSVKGRLELLSSQFSSFVKSSVNLVTPGSKKVFEVTGGTFVAAMVQAAVTPLALDYGSALAVFDVLNLLIDVYNTYVGFLDTLQTPNGGSPDSYIPDPIIGQLQDTVAYTASQLFGIAVNAQQERSMILGAASNVVILAHRFYGMDPDDNNIDRFIASNNIGIDELLQIPKGRKVVWYV